MKIKTSISISEEILAKIDELAKSSNRSDFIEYALKEFFQLLERKEINARDLSIINKNSSRLNKEALDVLHFQV